jgi:hypothetical protein
MNCTNLDVCSGVPKADFGGNRVWEKKRIFRKKKNPNFDENEFKNVITPSMMVPNNPITAFRLGSLFGMRDIYDNIINGNYNKKHLTEIMLRVIDILQPNSQFGAPGLNLDHILRQNIPTNPFDAFEFGRMLGIKKAIEYSISVNFNKNLIKDNLSIISNELEKLR